MKAIFDASALLALFRDEPGAEVVERALMTSPGECFAHAINVCECFYATWRSSDSMAADAVVEDLKGVGLLIREDLDEALWKDAGVMKARSRIENNGKPAPIADCLCVALVRRLDGEVVTADHNDLDWLVANGACKARFIR